LIVGSIDIYRASRKHALGIAAFSARRNRSGERDYNGYISKAGNPNLRSAPCETANNLRVRAKPPFVLRTWSKRLAETKGHKCARVAVARWQPIILQEQFMGVWQKIIRALTPVPGRLPSGCLNFPSNHFERAQWVGSGHINYLVRTVTTGSTAVSLLWN
jgi:hypothetical protein